VIGNEHFCRRTVSFVMRWGDEQCQLTIANLWRLGRRPNSDGQA
jgi:hypothetical protein